MSSGDLTTISVETRQKDQMVDITTGVSSAVGKTGISRGICYVFVPHTTAALTINENADPAVRSDVLMGLERIVPEDLPYDHMEGNSTAHIKSSMIGNSVIVPVDDGKLVLGTWQGIYFCEFDGPRTRKYYVRVMEG